MAQSQTLNSTTQRGAKSICRISSSEPADSLWEEAEAGSKAVLDRVMLEVLPGCRASQLCKGKENYSSRLTVAKTTQKRDCSATKGTLPCSCLPLQTDPSLPHKKTIRTLMRNYNKSNFYPMFACNEKN